MRRLAESGLVVDTGDAAAYSTQQVAATLTVEPSLAGARTAALRGLRAAIIAGQ